jgi:ribosomal protein L25 (general stress protein Ctc)
MNRFSKKKLLAGLAGIGVLAIAAGAYAYFTTTGSGTATATVGSSTALIIKGTVTGNLYPGTSSPVNLTIDNNSTGKQRVGTISLEKITPDVGHSTCSVVITGGTPDFTMADIVVNKVFGPGAGQAVTPNGSLTMNDTGVSQDACQGATLTLALKSN